MSDVVLIWGAGAIGGTIGAYLASAGQRVLLVDQDEAHVAAINNRGLHIEGPVAEFQVRVPACLPQDVSDRFGHIILAVKSQHTLAAVASLRNHVTETGTVLSAQNGLNGLVLSRELGPERVIPSLINFGADWQAPGRIHYGGRGAVAIGEQNGDMSQRLAAWQSRLATFDPDVTMTNNIWGFIWGKLGYGALLFATALTEATIADVLASPRHRAVLHQLGCEAMAVARALGVNPVGVNGFDVPAFTPTAPRAAIDASFASMADYYRKSGKARSGVWRDLAVRKRKTEVDPQITAIVEQGRALGVATPVTARLVQLIQEIELGQREMGWPNLDALAA